MRYTVRLRPEAEQDLLQLGMKGNKPGSAKNSSMNL
jgi:hypothetical protein